MKFIIGNYRAELLLIILLGLINTGRAQSSKTDANALERLERAIDSLYNSKIEDDGPGAALLITYQDKRLISKGFGLRDIEGQKPITPTTNLRIGSVSKQFTSLAVLSLVDKSLIALTDTVYKFIPSDVFANVTVEQLIYHTSGIADYEEYFVKNRDNTIALNNQDVLEWFYQSPESLFKPGEKWDYSNSGYNILATLVEKVSGENFENF